MAVVAVVAVAAGCAHAELPPGFSSNSRDRSPPTADRGEQVPLLCRRHVRSSNQRFDDSKDRFQSIDDRSLG